VKILVLNGSPKGNNSVTMSYIKYLQKVYPEQDIRIKTVALSITKLEKNETAFQELISEIQGSDGVIWAYPLYFMLVCSNYKRFIELIWERKAEQAFQGKYCISLSTSIHFYDHTANNYIHAICDDLGMNFVGTYSAESHDLLDAKKRSNLEKFFEEFILAIQEKANMPKAFPAVTPPSLVYRQGPMGQRVDLGDRKLVIVTDQFNPQDSKDNLSTMVHRLKENFIGSATIVDLSTIKINGGCLGCLHCGIDNICAYDGKDDVRKIYETELATADIVIFAGTIRDRYLSSRWKCFIDRGFFHTHQPSFSGKQFGYLIAGPLGQNANLREILEAYVEMSYANLVGIVTDEAISSQDLDNQLEYFAKRVAVSAEKDYFKPNTFLGVGGAKLFRDEIWGELRFIFQKDYQYLKRHKMLDFPQRQWKTRLFNFFLPFTRIPSVKKMIQLKTMDMMHLPHDKVVQSARKKI
jgi:multimeric flavodoxin WrbA